jgi:hypothetical protein
MTSRVLLVKWGQIVNTVMGITFFSYTAMILPDKEMNY